MDLDSQPPPALPSGLHAAEQYDCDSGLRYLPHMTDDNFFELYRSHDGTASRSKFLSQWKNTWASRLRIRPNQSHNPCNDCIAFKVRRADVTTPAEHRLVSAAYKEHLDAIQDLLQHRQYTVVS